MATTRTPGIVLAGSRRFIDKRYLGVRIVLRVGAVTQEQAEQRLRAEMTRVESDLARKAHARPTFTDCAARYLEQSRAKRSIDVIKWHIGLFQTYIGGLEPQQVHDKHCDHSLTHGWPPVPVQPRLIAASKSCARF